MSRRAARCRGCGERLDATHRPACSEGTEAVLEGDTTPPMVSKDPGPERTAGELLEAIAAELVDGDG